MRTLVLGDAHVDLLCPRPAASLSGADAFVPSLDGSPAGLAERLARAGAEVALAGAAGDDAWGRWVRERLEGAGVDTGWLALAAGAVTPVSFTTVDDAGRPSSVDYGEPVRAIAATLGDRLLDAVEQTDALVLTSGTLAGEHDRALTLAARDRALELGRPVVVDVRIRAGRWAAPATAATAARELVKGAFLVRCTGEEGRLLSGEERPDAAAAGLLAMGARHVVVTTGAAGALVRGGGLKLDVPARAIPVVRPLGAGDAFCAVLLGRLAATDFYPAAIAAALPDAVEAAAQEVSGAG